MKKILEFLLEHKQYLRPIEIKMVNAALEKLDMDRTLSEYETYEFCQMKSILDLKLDPPS